MAASLIFYFDFISPYAYLGWRRVRALAERHGRVVQPVPVLFAAMLDAYGHRGPAEIPPKRLYTWKHVLRLAHDQGVELQPPPAHPFNPLLGLRIASVPQNDADRDRTIDVLYDMTWRDRRGITDPGVVRQALDDATLPGASLIEQATSDEGKARVRQQTDAALAGGVFGVPTVEVDREQFWGQDAFPHVERFLQGDDPVTQDAVARWADLPASSQRKP